MKKNENLLFRVSIFRILLMKKLLVLVFGLLLCGCSVSAPEEVVKVPSEEFVCGVDKVTDADGNEYKTAYFDIDGGHDVTKEGQCWMAENLNVGKVILNPWDEPSDDSVIEKWCPELKAKYDVMKDESCYYVGGGKRGKHCFPDMGDLGNTCETTWGGIYTWEEVVNYDLGSQKGICPLGWKVPSDYDWEVLRENVRKTVVRSDFLDVQEGEILGYGDKLPVGRKLKRGAFQGIYVEKKGEYVLTPYDVTFLSVNKEWIKDYYLQDGFGDPGLQYELSSYLTISKEKEKGVLTLEEFKKQIDVPAWVKVPEVHWYKLEYKKYLENQANRYRAKYSVRCIKN